MRTMPEESLLVAADASQGPRTRPSEIGRWLVFASSSTLAVLVAMARLDLPVAAFVSSNLSRAPLYGLTTRVLGTLSLVVVLALTFLVAAGLSALSGRRMASFLRTPLLCSWSVLWALATTIVLKRLFGRSSIDPVRLARSVYDFHPFRGAWGHEAFPSGTTTIASAILSVLWIRLQPSRLAGALLLAVIGVALIATNSHWVSDILAGLFFGTCVGWMTARLLGEDHDAADGTGTRS